MNLCATKDLPERTSELREERSQKDVTADRRPCVPAGFAGSYWYLPALAREQNLSNDGDIAALSSTTLCLFAIQKICASGSINDGVSLAAGGI